MLDAIFSPDLFYRKALEASGVTPPQLDMEKIAAADNKSVEVVKLAHLFYAQTKIDDLAFENEAQRKENAYMLAEAYIAQAKSAEVEATKIADGLVRFLKHAAEGYLAQNQIDLTADEALKVAALQIEQPTDAEAKVAGAGSQFLLERAIAAETAPAPATDAAPAAPAAVTA